MENNPFRGLFGASSPRPEEQRVAPQRTAPTANIYYEIPSSMIKKLLANPYAGDGTLHPDMHLIYVDDVCGLFQLAGMPEDVFMTHKYMGSAVTFSISNSVEPNEKQKEMTSGFHQGNVCKC